MDRIPDVTFQIRRECDWHRVRSTDLFRGKKVVAFALPGAFTPTCSSSHVPRFEELAPVFKAAGIDEILCFSVNDGFIMEAWQAAERAPSITFVPDTNGDFARGMGMLSETPPFGLRSRRYSMLVEDGAIKKMFVEKDTPGDPFDVSDADTMLAHLGVKAPPNVLMITREGCPHCLRARKILGERGLAFTELPSSPRTLRALGAKTTPQIFVDGKHVGGCDALADYFGR